MSGLEAAEVIRREINTTLPIIALTANAIRGESEKCLAAGMNDYLAKPFEEGAFIKMICEWVGKGAAAPGGGCKAGEGAGREAPAGRPLYDFHRLEEIGDRMFVKKMVQLFVDTVPAAVRELQVAAAIGDFQTVFSKAHSLKPSLHNFSIDCLGEDVLELERLAKAAGPANRITELANRVGEIVGKVVEGLRG
jgi:CheY-like chemotaxis protein